MCPYIYEYEYGEGNAVETGARGRRRGNMRVGARKGHGFARLLLAGFWTGLKNNLSSQNPLPCWVSRHWTSWTGNFEKLFSRTHVLVSFNLSNLSTPSKPKPSKPFHWTGCFLNLSTSPPIHSFLHEFYPGPRAGVSLSAKKTRHGAG